MECAGCTLCCKLLKIEWMNSPAGEYCIECFPGKGCMIYDEAPEKCLEFKCAYNQMEKVSINMRPDKCGVIFIRVDDIIAGRIDDEVTSPNEYVQGQLEFFKNEGFPFVLYKQGNKPYVYQAKGYTKQEILDKVRMELERANGGS